MSTPLVLEHPQGVQRRQLHGTDGLLAALEARPPEGTPLRGIGLLLPGFTGSKEDFTAILAPLAARGWWTVALDLRGQFESPGPDTETAYRLVDYTGDVLEVLSALVKEIAAEFRRGDSSSDEVRVKVHLVGHSMGGLVARDAALGVWGTGGAAYADSTVVLSSLTLLCSGPGALPEESRAPLHELEAALPHTSLDLIWTIMRTRSGEPHGGDPVSDFLRDRFVANNPWALKAMGTILCEAPDRIDELAGVRPPGSRDQRVLVAYGEGDDAWPPDVQDAMAARLGVEPVVVAGAGHSPASETHESAAAIVEILHDFWSRTAEESAIEGSDAV